MKKLVSLMLAIMLALSLTGVAEDTIIADTVDDTVLADTVEVYHKGAVDKLTII